MASKLLNKTAQEILENVKKSGFSTLNSDFSYSIFQEANNIFQNFRSYLSHKGKKRLHKKLREVYGEIGYVEKKSKYDDTKYYFHYNTFLEDLFQKEKDKFSKTDVLVIDIFLENIKPLYEKIEHYAREFLLSMDKIEKDFSKNFIHESGKMMCFYRLLEYPFNNDDHSNEKPLAQAHTDSGAFTFALYETCPGLEVCRGEDEKTATSIEHRENKMLLFPGRSFQQFHKGIEPSIHQVKKVESCFIEGGSRFAHVFFVWPICEFDKNIFE